VWQKGRGGYTEYAIHLRPIPETIEQPEVYEDRGNDYDSPGDGYREVASVESVWKGWKLGRHAGV
jgi:hypothetical protein